MTHISRPFQIALAAMVLFVAVWFVALRGHSSATESSNFGAPASVPPATPQPAAGSSSGSGSGGSSGSASSPSSTYHGSAPGVGGLTRAIAKARGAVAQQQKSDQASSSVSTQSNETSSTSASRSGSSAASQRSAAGSPARTSPAKAAPKGAKAHSPASGAGARAKSAVPAMQLQVEGQLKHGKTVAILFWNPKGSVDAVVHRELQAVGRKLNGKLAVHVARSSQVGSFGTFTRAVQVYSTPTILLINSKGATSSVTGLTDSFAIEQAAGEVERSR